MIPQKLKITDQWAYYQLFNQISECINQFLSPYLCGYRQGFSTQQALVSLIEKWKAILDKNGYAGAEAKLFASH